MKTTKQLKQENALLHIEKGVYRLWNYRLAEIIKGNSDDESTRMEMDVIMSNMLKNKMGE